MDLETGPIVRRIFNYAHEGVTPFMISMILKKEGILKPRSKLMKDTGKYVSDHNIKYPYDWSNQTIFFNLKKQRVFGSYRK